MFSKLKNTIRELAHNAVAVAEQSLSGEAGKAKKKMAADYVVSNLPLPLPLKQIASMLLAKFIDEAIEFAVQYMNSLSEEQ